MQGLDRDPPLVIRDGGKVGTAAKHFRNGVMY
jgi:hypothetical protein